MARNFCARTLALLAVGVSLLLSGVAGSEEQLACADEGGCEHQQQLEAAVGGDAPHSRDDAPPPQVVDGGDGFDPRQFALDGEHEDSSERAAGDEHAAAGTDEAPASEQHDASATTEHADGGSEEVSPPPPSEPEPDTPTPTPTPPPEYPITELEDAVAQSLAVVAGLTGESPLRLDDDTRAAVRARLHALLPYALAGLVTAVPQPDGHVFTGPDALSAAGGAPPQPAGATPKPTHPRGLRELGLPAAVVDELRALLLPQLADGGAGAVVHLPPHAVASLLSINVAELRAAWVQRAADVSSLGAISPLAASEVPPLAPLPDPAALAAAVAAHNGSLPRELLAFARQEAVRRSVLHAYAAGYEAHAFGSDILRPLSRRGDEHLCKMGETLVDSLDTLLLAAAPGPYARARAWVDAHLAFGGGGQNDINLFETTIRIVGGLLAAYDLTADGLFLARAEELAETMVGAGAFESRTGLPFGTLTLWPPPSPTAAPEAAAAAAAAPEESPNATSPSPLPSLPGPGAYGSGGRGYAYNPGWIGGASSLSEVATLQLELNSLSAGTGNGTYAALGRRVMRHLAALRPPLGLYPMYVDPLSGGMRDATITLGARGDSAYEYMLKQWLQLRGDEWAYEAERATSSARLALQMVLQGRALAAEAEWDRLDAEAAAAAPAAADSGDSDAAAAATSADAPAIEGASGDDGAAATASAARTGGTTPAAAGGAFGVGGFNVQPSLAASDYVRVVAREAAEDPRFLLRLYNDAVCGIMDRLRLRSTPGGLWYVAEMLHTPAAMHGQDPALVHKMDHLVCFLPGVLGLGAAHGAGHEAMATAVERRIRRAAAGDAVRGFLAWARDATPLPPAAEEGAAAAGNRQPAATVAVPPLGIVIPRQLLVTLDDDEEGDGEACVGADGTAAPCDAASAAATGRAGDGINGTMLGWLVSLWSAPEPDAAAPPPLDPSQDGPTVPVPFGWLVEDVLHVMRQLDAARTQARRPRGVARGSVNVFRPQGRTAAQALADEVALIAEEDERAAAAAEAARAAAAAANASAAAAAAAATSAEATAEATPSADGETPAAASADVTPTPSPSAPPSLPTFPLPSPSPVGPVHDPTAQSFCGLTDPEEARRALADAAEALADTCIAMYDRTSTGLAPEIVTFTGGSDFRPNHDARHCLLRPETAESLFVLHRLTGKPKYADAAWRMFDSFERHARVRGGGYASLHNVEAWPLDPGGEGYSPGRGNMDDKMESFWLAETLKYLYLIHDGSGKQLPLGEWVLNTEAHPLRKLRATKPTAAGAAVAARGRAPAAP